MNENIQKVDLVGQELIEIAVKIRQGLQDFPDMETDLKAEFKSVIQEKIAELQIVDSML